MGFSEQVVPRRNLGTVSINNQNGEIIAMSSENVLVIEPNSFTPFKFNYPKIQKPKNYSVGFDESVYANEDPYELTGANILEQVTTIWDDFYLVVKYIDDKGTQLSKTRMTK